MERSTGKTSVRTHFIKLNRRTAFTAGCLTWRKHSFYLPEYPLYILFFVIVNFGLHGIFCTVIIILSIYITTVFEEGRHSIWKQDFLMGANSGSGFYSLFEMISSMRKKATFFGSSKRRAGLR
jgi:hypothetical protein